MAMGSIWTMLTSGVPVALAWTRAAGPDVHGAGAAGEGRADLVVAQRDGGGFHRGGVRVHQAAAALQAGQRGVQGALRDEVLRQQVLGAFVLALQVAEAGLVAGELGPRLVEVGAVRALVEAEQDLTLGDRLAVVDQHVADRRGGLGAEVDLVDRRDGAGGFDGDRDVAALRGDHADGLRAGGADARSRRARPRRDLPHRPSREAARDFHHQPPPASSRMTINDRTRACGA